MELKWKMLIPLKTKMLFLLIEPYGIEMSIGAERVNLKLPLLIEPYGIEMKRMDMFIGSLNRF